MVDPRLLPHQQRCCSNCWFNECMGKAVDEALASAIKKQAPLDVWSQLQGFFAAIDWSESWIVILLCSQAILLLTACATRKKPIIQLIILAISLGGVLMAERLNNWCRLNWKSFATQDYFDRHGIFISFVFSFPLICTSIFVLLYGLYNASSLLISVKRLQLAAKRRAAAKSAGNVSSTNNGSDKAKTS